jgi:hypothetical protein
MSLSALPVDVLNVAVFSSITLILCDCAQRTNISIASRPQAPSRFHPRAAPHHDRDCCLASDQAGLDRGRGAQSACGIANSDCVRSARDSCPGDPFFRFFELCHIQRLGDTIFGRLDELSKYRGKIGLDDGVIGLSLSLCVFVGVGV